MTEQKATVVVTANQGAHDEELTRLALLELDKSGGTEWQTVVAWVDERRVLP